MHLHIVSVHDVMAPIPREIWDFFGARKSAGWKEEFEN